MKERFSAEEWSTLSILPAFVFVRVAGADSEIDDLEIKSMRELLGRPDQCMDPLHGQILADLTQDDLDVVLGPGASLSSEQFETITTLLRERLDYDEYHRFAASLLDHGMRIARASGGFLGLGSKVSGVERKALDSLARALDLGPEVVERIVKG